MDTGNENIILSRCVHAEEMRGWFTLEASCAASLGKGVAHSPRWRRHALREGVFTLGDARSFSGLTSKIPPLGSMLNLTPTSKRRLRVTNMKTASLGMDATHSPRWMRHALCHEARAMCNAWTLANWTRGVLIQVSERCVVGVAHTVDAFSQRSTPLREGAGCSAFSLQCVSEQWRCVNGCIRTACRPYSRQQTLRRRPLQT